MSSYYILEMLNLENIKKFLNYEFNNDQFNIESLLDKNVLQDLGFKDAIIYNYDSVVSDNIENADIRLENIMEARFFNESMEMRIFNEEEKISGILFKENGIKESEIIMEEYLLYKRNAHIKKYPKKLKVKKYISYGEDSQAYISYVKPCKFIY